MWLVMSDSHDNLSKVEKAVKIALQRKVSALFHLGDFNSPFVIPRLLKEDYKFFGVFGNNDGDLLFLEEKAKNKISHSPHEIILEGKKVFMMHQPFALEAAKKSQLYDFVFYGHTHKLHVEKIGKTLIVNPGESCGYLTSKATCVLVDERTGKYEVIDL